MTSLAYSRDEIQTFDLPTNDIPPVLSFDGWFIAGHDNGGADRLRWAVLNLYRWLPQGKEEMGYILHTTGRSVVYHYPNGECGKGEIHEYGEFPALCQAGIIEDPAELEPCDRCDPAPLAEAAGADEFEVEITWYKWVACRDAQELIRSGRRDPRCKQCFCRPHDNRACGTCACTDYTEAPRPLTIPMQRLLAKAKTMDQDIARAMREHKTRL